MEQDDAAAVGERVVFFNREVERLRRHSLRRHIFDPGTGIRHFDADAEVAGHVDRQVAAFHTESIHALADEQLRNGRRLTDDDLLFHIQGRCLEAEFTTPLGESFVLIDSQGEGTGRHRLGRSFTQPVAAGRNFQLHIDVVLHFHADFLRIAGQVIVVPTDHQGRRFALLIDLYDLPARTARYHDLPFPLFNPIVRGYIEEQRRGGK